jgi:hypothetical protein
LNVESFARDGREESEEKIRKHGRQNAQETQNPILRLPALSSESLS